jgi:hypothetical protein
MFRQGQASWCSSSRSTARRSRSGRYSLVDLFWLLLSFHWDSSFHQSRMFGLGRRSRHQGNWSSLQGCRSCLLQPCRPSSPLALGPSPSGSRQARPTTTPRRLLAIGAHKPCRTDYQESNPRPGIPPGTLRQREVTTRAAGNLRHQLKGRPGRPLANVWSYNQLRQKIGVVYTATPKPPPGASTQQRRRRENFNQLW